MSIALAKPRSPMFLAVLAAAVVMAATVPATAAEEPAGGLHLLPEDAAVTLEVQQPLRLLDHPLLIDVWKRLQASSQLQLQLQRPKVDRARAIARALGARLGVGWREAIEKVTAGGLVFGLVPGEPGQVTVILTADTPETMAAFVAFLRELDEAENADKPDRRQPVEKKHRGIAYYKIGDGFFSTVGPRLIVTSRQPLMTGVLDRLLDGKKGDAAAGNTSANQSSAGGADPPLARLTVNLDAIREREADFERALRIPSENPIPVFLLGNWIDLLRRSHRVVIELSPAESTIDLAVRFDAPDGEITPGLEGFFADGKERTPAPLLKVPGTIYSSSYCRDYRAIWNARGQLFTDGVKKSLEAGNQQAKQQMMIAGGNFLPSDLLGNLGTQFRVVVARQQKNEYDVQVKNRLPAAALAVSLRDEKFFLTKVAPVLRAVSGFATANRQLGLTLKDVDFRDASLVSLVYRDEKGTASQVNPVRYNFSPTHTFTRGHFIIGSTREIVQQVIDELDRQAGQESQRPPAGATGIEMLSFAAAAEALGDVRDSFLRNIVFDQGLSLAEAEKELGVVLDALKALGRTSLRTGFTGDGYRIRLRLGEQEN